jgi:hypothetical protein
VLKYFNNGLSRITPEGKGNRFESAAPGGLSIENLRSTASGVEPGL